MSLITIVVTVIAVAASLAYNRRVWRPEQAADPQHTGGLSTAEVAVPLMTLAVVLVVFVLVQVFSSWTAAGRAETSEATATLLLFREAELLHDVRVRETVRKELVCYATSVVDQDWPAMADRHISNVPTFWSGRVRAAGVRQARGTRFESAGEAFVARDGERARARQERLGEARPSVPVALYLLMLLAVAGTLGIMGVVTGAAVRPGVHTAIVVVAAVTFGATLLLIRDFDQPYKGLTGRDPGETMFVRDQIASEVRGPLPCDDRGLPRDDPGFRATTSPLR
jgi:hypothetical protein